MILISLLLVDEQKDTKLFNLYFPSDSPVGQKKFHAINKKVDSEEANNSKSALAILFDVNNVKDMFHTFTKPRQHNIRLHIVLLVLASMTYLLAYLGPGVFMYQYVQKTFSWNSSQYSNYVTVTSIVNILSMFLIAPVLINVSAN